MSGLDGRLIAQASVDCMAEAGFFQNCWLPSHFLVEVGQVSRQPRVVDNFCPHIIHFWERWLEIEGCVCLCVCVCVCVCLEPTCLPCNGRDNMKEGPIALGYWLLSTQNE